jgi:hypothetical protein
VFVTVAQIVFSSVDLGLTYDRTMTVLGVALGLAAPLSAWAISERRLDRGVAVESTPPQGRLTPSGPRTRVGRHMPTVTS